MGKFTEFCKDERMGALLLLLLVNDDISVLVPVKQLDPVATLVAEDKNVPRERVVVQVLSYLLGQSVEATA
jgi:hypothetical protein